MKDDRLNHRFWTVAMSGTMINSDPTDIQAITDIFGSESWFDPTHKLHALTPPSLHSMKLAINRNIVNRTRETTAVATTSVDTFAKKVPFVVIRRHEDSRWWGESSRDDYDVRFLLFVLPQRTSSELYNYIN